MEAAAPVIGPTRFERRRLQNRTALLEAAWHLFQRKGTRETTVDEICERADVSTRTFFNHFKTREHLYLAISEMRTAEFAAVVVEAGQDPAKLEERLVRFFATLGAALKARPAYRELVALMLGRAMERGSELSHSGALGQAVLGFVETAAERGEIGSPHSPQRLADLVLGSFTMVLVNWFASAEYDPELEMTAAAHLLLEVFQPQDPNASDA